VKFLRPISRSLLIRGLFIPLLPMLTHDGFILAIINPGNGTGWIKQVPHTPCAYSAVRTSSDIVLSSTTLGHPFLHSRDDARQAVVNEIVSWKNAHVRKRDAEFVAR
jgi:hypothetical protein